MDLDTMLADAAPARHTPLDGPGSPAAADLYQRIIARPPAAARPARRPRFALAALAGAGAAALAAVVALALTGGSPVQPGGPPRTELAAWSVTRQPDGLVIVTIRELRDPAGLWRMLRADGVPANVRFLPHDFVPTTSPSAIPAACRAPHMSNRANAILQGKIMPPPITGEQIQSGHSHRPGRPRVSWGVYKNSSLSAVLFIRPSAIPHGIGLFLKAWAAKPGTRSGQILSMDTGLVQVSPQCTGRHP